MRSMMRTSQFLAVCFMAMPVIGCHEHRDVAYRDHDADRPVVVEQGYYYDHEYVDEYGHNHPRVYYYYDGHDYERHDAPPPNVIVHERMDRDDMRRRGERGDRDEMHPSAREEHEHPERPMDH
ncbi:MAG: hypothetical protein JO353_07830 [Phycisphaerae bacterium]|nr:hypothetical protein [Phycisphaerae bacterium]